MRSDPAEQIETARLHRNLPRYLNLDEVERVLEVSDVTTPEGLRDRAMLELLYATGLRVSELIALEFGDFNFDVGYLVCEGKGRKERIVPFGRSAKKWLERYLREGRLELVRKTTDAFFLSRLGKAMTRQRFFQILKSCGKRAGIDKPLSPHVADDHRDANLNQPARRRPISRCCWFRVTCSESDAASDSATVTTSSTPWRVWLAWTTSWPP